MDKFYCPEIVLMDCREKMAIYFQYCVQIYESPSEVLYRVADLDSPLYFFEKHQLSKQTLGKLIMELIDSKQYRLYKLKFSEVLTIANKMQAKIEHQICPLSFSSDSKNFDFSLGCQKVIVSKEEESNIFYIQPCVTFSRSASLFLYPAQRWLWLSGDREDFQSLLGEQIKEALEPLVHPIKKKR